MSGTCTGALIEDGSGFSSLVNGLGGQSLYRALYGPYNFTSLVEYSYLSLVSKSDDGVLGGFVSVNDGLPGDSEPFDDFIEKLSISVPDCSVLNVLCLNFFAYNVKISGPDVGSSLLRCVFARCPNVNYLFWLCPTTARAPPFISTFFVETASADESEIFKKNKLFILRRDAFLPQLLVREAIIEDNDDLLPILRSTNPGLVEGHDDFFLADMIQSQNDHNKIFVGVDKEKPVGMLATSLDVNAALLTRVFDLQLYPGVIAGGNASKLSDQLIVMVLGESKLVSSFNFKELSVSLGGNYLDVASMSDRRLEFLDAEAVINFVVSLPSSPAAFCTLVGYPRSEAEARDLVTRLVTEKINIVVLEVQASAADQDDPETPEVIGDDTEELLLDAIEYLRSQLVRGDTVPDEMQACPAVDWVKVDMAESNESSGKSVSLLSNRLNEITNLHKISLSERADDIDSNLCANAFAVTLFCIEEGFESRSEDMLRVAFEEHPSLDYCLLMIPNGVGTIALTSCMSSPRVRPGVSFDQTLFLVHRDYLLTNSYFKVQRYSRDMQSQLGVFLNSLDPSEGQKLASIFEHSTKELDVPLFDNPSEACFVATVQGVIVATMGISRKMTTTDNLIWMRQNYLIDHTVNFERHRSRSQAMITNWVMNPIFSKAARFMIREVMRMFQKTLLYYESPKGGVPSPEALFEMIPVRPKLYIHTSEPSAADEELDEEKGPQFASDKKSRSNALFLMTKMDLCNNKILVSKRVVVIGGNSSAFSVLETFCYSKDVYLSNICFVTEYDNFTSCGDMRFDDSKPDENNMKGSLSARDIGDPTRSYLDALGIASRITMVSGKLTDIDRKSKAVVISDDIAIEYDILVIATGTQDATFKKVPGLSTFHPLANMKRGVFGLGNPIVDGQAEEWIMSGVGSKTEDKIVVAGSSENALVAISRLLELGVQTDRLLWLAPFAEQLIDLGHPDVNECAENSLQVLNIATYQGIIEDLNINEADGTVAGIVVFRKRLDTDVISTSGNDDDIRAVMSTIEITSETEAREFVSCKTILFCNNPNQCDIDLFEAIKDCGLVYDGGVVVDKSFRTVDESIYAVGNFTRYSRRYKNAPRHEGFNAREVGIYVANEVLKTQFLDKPVAQFETVRPPFDLFEFSAPKIVEFALPGGLYYYKSKLPDSYPVLSPTNSLRSLTTRCVHPENVFVVKCNSLGVVVEMLYIGVDPIENCEIGRLVGMHEALLNSAIYTYEKALIKDWVIFFRGEWVNALLHEDFNAFRKSVSDSVMGEKFVLSLMDGLSERMAGGATDETIALAAQQILGDRCAFAPDTLREAIEAPLLEFAKKFKTDLPGLNLHIPSSAQLKQTRK